MKCAACPFSLTCLRGRLGHPYELRLCPQCGCICFLVEEHVTVDVNMHSHRRPQQPMMEERKNAHIVIFQCEKRQYTPNMLRTWAVRAPREQLMEAQYTDKVDLDDPGPGQQSLFQLRKCYACSGQFDRAGAYWKVHFHELDTGDAMPQL